MARKPRIHYPGAVYHVMLRGNAGDPIFFEDRDRYRFYLLLQHAVETFGCRIHGFCLMTNHVHLVLQTGDIHLSRIMQNISQRYTNWINLTRRRSGHVFQGRFKAILIDGDAYLLELVRYVHLNPVRAGAAATVDAWPWSGHHAYVGKETVPWLTTDWVLGMLSSEETAARKAYVAYVNDGVAEGRRAEFHSGSCEGRLLGSDSFVDAVVGKSRHVPERLTVADLLEAVCAVYGCTREELRAPGKARPYSEARAVASLLVQEASHLALTELGQALQREIPTLGRSGRRILHELERDERLGRLVEEVRCRLEMEKKAERQA